MLSLSFSGNVLKAVVHFLYSDEVRAIKGVFVGCAHKHAHTCHLQYILYFIFSDSRNVEFVSAVLITADQASSML